MKPDTLVKLRDAFTLAADALQDELERSAPAGVKRYDLEKIVWHQKTGDKGPFELALVNEQTSDNLRTLIAGLEEHSGKMQNSGYFLWLMSDKKSVGRKPSRK